jgi:hypothetical protein
MSKTVVWERIKKLRNGRGWCVSYPVTGIGDIYASPSSNDSVVMFRMKSNEESLEMACDYCEWMNKKRRVR